MASFLVRPCGYSTASTGLAAARRVSSNLVPRERYPAVLKRLEEDTHSYFRNRHVVGTVYNAIKGSVSANFYTDKWPDFSTLVGQIIFPRLSEDWDIICYTSSGDNLLRLLEEENLVTVGKRQVITTNQDEESLKAVTPFLSKSVSSFQGYFNYLPKSVTMSPLYERSPEGYSIRRLEPCHAEFIRSYWPYCTDWPNATSMFENCIRNFNSAAAFVDEDQSYPVAWYMQHAHTEIGHQYVLENHRKKCLSKYVIAAFVKSIKENSPEIIPWGISPRPFLEDMGIVGEPRFRYAKYYNYDKPENFVSSSL